MPRLGMGTWHLGEVFSRREQEIEAIRAGLDAGIQLIDTAEMYENGASEHLIGQAIKEYERDEIHWKKQLDAWKNWYLRGKLDGGVYRILT